MATELCTLAANFNVHVGLEIARANGKWTVHFANFNVHVGLEIARASGNWTVHFVC